ncbi:hypothetical protein NS226_07235 [Aureimonas ureilytica]|uniref:Helix-turn-helix domain-containing protein n=1 Tax=Aureimonas ureilytica TaxID=401562 RepID=A0A175RB84_9HYPH|nr:hypothetical protein [Aureimonas ureilytica]KTQ96585.1 hypothetical protein NS226_07235 [Aureimonas ureilytica]
MVSEGNEGESLQLLWGAKAISKFIGRTQRATFGMLENGELPAKKVSGSWVVDRSQLVAFFRDAAQ